MSAEEVLSRFGSTIKHPDIELFITAMLLNLREGASLSGSLERLTKVIRQRQSFRRKTRAGVAMQRLSAIGISMAFVAILGIQTVTNYDTMKEVLHHPIGKWVLAFGITLLLVGAGLMMRLCKSRV